MIELKMEGVDELAEMARRIRYALSPAVLTDRVMVIAEMAGQLLLRASVQACVEAVYAHPNFPSSQDLTPSNITVSGDEYGGNWEERTNALYEAHVLRDQGLTQIVEIDPDAEVADPHSGREFVIDYAVPVHDGYTQWVMGVNTGVYHEGRFWFDVAALEAEPVIASFIMVAFTEAIVSMLEFV